MTHYERGKRLFDKTIQAFRLLHPENYQRLWVEGNPPVGWVPLIVDNKVVFPPDGFSFEFTLGDFTVRAMYSNQGLHVWVGLHDGSGVLTWMPDNEGCQCTNGDLVTTRLENELDRVLLLEDLSSI